MENKEESFLVEVLSYSDYDLKMLDDFFSYWSEPNKSKTKMKWELERTWDTKRRLKRWFDNNKKWNHETNGKFNAEKPGTSDARIAALKDWSIGGKIYSGTQ